MVVKEAIERIFVKLLKNEDSKIDLQDIVMKSITSNNDKEMLLEPQINKYLTSGILWVKTFMDLFPPDLYMPVYGPFTTRVKIGKTPIDLEISAICRSKKYQTLHAITFCPFTTKHAILNDIPTYMKLKLLKPLVKKHHSGRPQAMVHILSYTKSHDLDHHYLTSNDLNKGYNKMVTDVIERMEVGYHFPIIPCNFACRYKATCLPGYSDE